MKGSGRFRGLLRCENESGMIHTFLTSRRVTSHFPVLERLIFTEDLSIFNATQLTAEFVEFHTKSTVISTKPELETCQNYQL